MQILPGLTGTLTFEAPSPMSDCLEVSMPLKAQSPKEYHPEIPVKLSPEDPNPQSFKSPTALWPS